MSLFFKKHNLDKYITGHGLEIGALDNPLNVKQGAARILYMDMADRDGLIRQNPETVPAKIRLPDIIASAEDQSPIQSESMDFVIACHVLEHLPNPLKALKEIYRVLKPGGVLYLSVPDKRYTFDSKRPVTPLSHVQRDYEVGATVESCDDHYREWIDFVESRKKTPVVRTVDQAKHYRIHFHVWTPDSIIEMLEFTANSLEAPFSLADYYYRNGDTEVVYILKKTEDYPVLSGSPLAQRYSSVRVVLNKVFVLFHAVSDKLFKKFFQKTALF